MVYEWCMYGVCMVYAWYMYGVCIVYVWAIDNDGGSGTDSICGIQGAGRSSRLAAGLYLSYFILRLRRYQLITLDTNELWAKGTIRSDMLVDRITVRLYVQTSCPGSLRGIEMARE